MVERKPNELQSANKNNESKYLLKVFGLEITQVNVIGILIAFSLIIVAVYVQIASKELKEASTPVLTDIHIKDPKTALKYGIRGYIEITSETGTPKSVTITRGKETNITILLHFVSHAPDFTETEVVIDPNREEGYTVELSLGPDKGTIKLNDYVSYDPSGRILLKANQTLPVIMTITVPVNFPSISMPLRAVGITADVPILHYMEEDMIG